MPDINLIVHPARLRILQNLSAESLTTQEIADRMPDVPKSSIYRHVKLLLEGGVVEVAETMPIRGVEERRYRLSADAGVDPDQLKDLSAEEHLALFTNLMLSVQQAYFDYLTRAELTDKGIDLVGDQVGFREIDFFASADEFAEFSQVMRESLQKLMANSPKPDRWKRKLVTITFPIEGPKIKKEV